MLPPLTRQGIAEPERGALSGWCELGWWTAHLVVVAEEEHALALTVDSLTRLDPLAEASGSPDGFEKAQRTAFDVGSVMLTQDRLDGFRCLVRVVKGNGGDEMVEHVRFHDPVHEVSTDDAEFAINGGGCSAREVPGSRLVMRKGRIGVLEEGDPYYHAVSQHPFHGI